MSAVFIEGTLPYDFVHIYVQYIGCIRVQYAPVIAQVCGFAGAIATSQILDTYLFVVFDVPEGQALTDLYFQQPSLAKLLR